MSTRCSVPSVTRGLKRRVQTDAVRLDRVSGAVSCVTGAASSHLEQYRCASTLADRRGATVNATLPQVKSCGICG
jgi:hypothetical protein